jgi:protein-L-isoaspartate(D-aspartate) O-methyltransferase
MIANLIAPRGIHDKRVLDMMAVVPRHEFLPAQYAYKAYEDSAIPLLDNQTASQPCVIALMLQALALQGNERVLEVGTGSGYQTALLCRLAGHVCTLERHPRLADRAARNLERLGYDNVDVHVGDGSQGLPDMAPFDAIIVTAAVPALPYPLRAQLNPAGGRMILPVGDLHQQYLECVTRSGNRWEIEQTRRVRFAPLLGRFGFKSYDKSDDHLASV